MNGSGDFKRGTIHENFSLESGCVRFLAVRKTEFGFELLLRYCFNESSRFIDSLVLLSKLTQGQLKSSRKMGNGSTYKKKQYKEDEENKPVDNQRSKKCRY
jgi:hypothetical protein